MTTVPLITAEHHHREELYPKNVKLIDLPVGISYQFRVTFNVQEGCYFYHRLTTRNGFLPD
jgi:hypothetical protein